MGDLKETNPNKKCYHYDGEFCDLCWPPKEENKGDTDAKENLK